MFTLKKSIGVMLQEEVNTHFSLMVRFIHILKYINLNLKKISVKKETLPLRLVSAQNLSIAGQMLYYLSYGGSTHAYIHIHIHTTYSRVPLSRGTIH